MFFRPLVCITLAFVVQREARAQCAPRGGAPLPRGVWDVSNATLGPSGDRSPYAISVTRGIACRADLAFADGVIEFELAPAVGGFAGIAFRMASSADYEIVYFRASGDRWAGVQYQPVYEGETTWQLYPGDGYEADLPADVATTPDGWVRVRIVVEGQRADVYFGDGPTPVLRVRELKRARASGPIGVWAAFPPAATSAPATIRSLYVPPIGSLTLAGVPRDVPAPNQLTRWRVSKRFPAPDSIVFLDTLSVEARRAAQEGRVATAETSGLLSLTAVVGNPAGPQRTNVFGGAGWGVAYAGITIHSDRAQIRRLSLNYSEAVGVYLDGALVYVGDNRYEARAKGQLGVVGREGETVPLRLHAGDNEVVLAVADKAFGWGFRARLDSLDTVRITP